MRNLHLSAALLLLLMACLSRPLPAQELYRLSAGFSTKEKLASGEARLTVGQVYFDKVIGKLVYVLSFPRAETWITQDTSVYRIVGDSVRRERWDPAFNRFSIFYLTLDQDLLSFGLDSSLFSLDRVESAGGQVISIWKPQARYQELLGEVHVVREGGLLAAAVFYKPSGEAVSKQFFRNYDPEAPAPFPREIVQIAYLDAGGQNTSVTTFRNLIFNEQGHESNYDMPLPE